ncbi:His Kinase A (phospho-acceptor) domain-containing protein [Amycolatopsis xylanica]|uniref:histidine kinase n=1 Tax=Amycolatopsis xylanica TaxID=589385 RepID=A0A1H3CTM6_9PSEU|nr:ATP-binding protein [Amycolatopsis xylanica]SDX57258.1 His Kinase A (phospho-acceptor) domain-containing protein [Amycolatopsis xylanica]
MLLPVKLAAAIAGVAIVGAGALGVSVHLITEDARVDQARSLLDSRVRAAAQAFEDSGVVTFGAVLDDPAVPAPLREAALRDRRATYLQPGGENLWAAMKVDGRVLSVHTSFAADRQAIAQLDRTLLVAGVATAALSTVLGVLIAFGLSRRLRVAARVARTVAAGDLEARVSSTISGRGRDEVAALGAAVDRMADALTARIETERQVTADIAHELRTPVTGLVTAAELLPPSQATELVRDRVEVLKTLVEDVLEVARHGGPPVEVVVDGRRIEVRDHGRGFPRDLMENGPRRFHTESRSRGGGHGLGLTVAMGQAKVLGASLTLSNAPDGGALAVLELPHVPLS